MNFNEKYPGAIPGKLYEDCMVLTPRENLDLEVGNEYQECSKCREPTRWVETILGKPACSETCLQKLDADFRDAVRREMQRESKPYES